MMKNKGLLTAIILLGLILSGISVNADSASNLLKMDVKRSTAADTVDVTFYTTGSNYNSVVTRKSDNKYVVLLPNTSGSASIVPSLGGVKDLISDINVKSVDDGIGGYTKVTFSTTKPVKIQTFTKKTEPLTKAQEEYKNMIAKHDSVPGIRVGQANNASVNTKPVSNTAKTAAQQPAKPAVNKTTQTSTPKTNTQKPATKTETKPSDSYKTVSKPTAQVIQLKPQASQPKSQTAKPKTEIVNTKPVENVQPKVNVPTENQTVSDVKPVEEAPKATPVENNVTETAETNTIASKFKIDEAKIDSFGLNKSKLRKIPLIGGLIVLGLFLFVGLFNLLVRMAAKSSQEFRKLFDTPVSRPSGIDKEELETIMNDESLNWQEKYKRYTETEDKSKNSGGFNNLAYVADMSGKKDALVETDSRKPISEVAAENLKNMEKPSVETAIENELKARISQMEHALSQTPSLNNPYVEQDNSVKSEENAISQKMAAVKLKAFAKNKSLREASRNLYSEFKKETKNGQYKEGRFVKLKNSPLSVSSRKSKNSIGAATDVIKAEDNLITVSEKAKNDIAYSTSSVGEYFSILDSEPAEKIANSFQNRSAASESGMTNTISGQKHANPYSNYTSDYMSMNNMLIRSTYTIDSQRSIHLVDVDGHSALIGKNGNNISLIKNFETMIYKPLQVRRDYNSVYIVRVGEFKCLVDAAAPKFGVLLEI